MSHYHVSVIKDGKWFVGRVFERPGVTTQGRTLDELVFMLRDAIALMWNERSASLELVLDASISKSPRRKSRPKARAA